MVLQTSFQIKFMNVKSKKITNIMTMANYYFHVPWLTTPSDILSIMCCAKTKLKKHKDNTSNNGLYLQMAGAHRRTRIAAAAFCDVSLSVGLPVQLPMQVAAATPSIIYPSLSFNKNKT
jgi:hypothetical protein